LCKKRDAGGERESGFKSTRCSFCAFFFLFSSLGQSDLCVKEIKKIRARYNKTLIIYKVIMGKKLSGAAKRKNKKEEEEAIAEAAIDLERLKLGPTRLWTGLVTHHRDIFVSHVLPKLNETDQRFFSKVNTESLELLKYAGIDASEMRWYPSSLSSISTLEYMWNNFEWGEKHKDLGTVKDHAYFCRELAFSNKLELLKWVREEKKCKWDEETINVVAGKGNLEMLKYCFANDCPYDEVWACRFAARDGYLDCLRFLFDTIKPSRETEKEAAAEAARSDQLDILKYFVEERKISDDAKSECATYSAMSGRLNCLKYLVEEAKAPLNDYRHVARARYFGQTECEDYLREKGCPEPTDAQYAGLVAYMIGYMSAIEQQ